MLSSRVVKNVDGSVCFLISCWADRRIRSIDLLRFVAGVLMCVSVAILFALTSSPSSSNTYPNLRVLYLCETGNTKLGYCMHTPHRLCGSAPLPPRRRFGNGSRKINTDAGQVKVALHGSYVRSDLGATIFIDYVCKTWFVVISLS